MIKTIMTQARRLVCPPILLATLLTSVAVAVERDSVAGRVSSNGPSTATIPPATADARSDYRETYRPQFHYTAPTGFLSDPNGLVYSDGEFHLFHQYFPKPYDKPRQRWGHAVSRDLVHWKRLPVAIHPHGGGNIWSGSAVVDRLNTAGLQTGTNPPIIAFYTWQKDFTQRLAYSNDHARTMIEYRDNPVVPSISGGRDRDPKVFWTNTGTAMSRSARRRPSATGIGRWCSTRAI